MSGGVRVSKVVLSLTVLLLIRVSKGRMIRGGQEGKILLLRLFVTSVVRRATRVMLVLRMRSGVSVVVRRGIQLQIASVVIWFVSTVKRKVIYKVSHEVICVIYQFTGLGCSEFGENGIKNSFENRLLRVKTSEGKIRILHLSEWHDRAQPWHSRACILGIGWHNRAPYWHDRANLPMRGNSEFSLFKGILSIPMDPKHLNLIKLSVIELIGVV